MTIALVVLGVVVYAGIGLAVFADADANWDSHTGSAFVYGLVWPVALIAIVAYPVVRRITRRKQQ